MYGVRLTSITLFIEQMQMWKITVNAIDRVGTQIHLQPRNDVINLRPGGWAMARGEEC